MYKNERKETSLCSNSKCQKESKLQIASERQQVIDCIILTMIWQLVNTTNSYNQSLSTHLLHPNLARICFNVRNSHQSSHLPQFLVVLHGLLIDQTNSDWTISECSLQYHNSDKIQNTHLNNVEQYRTIFDNIGHYFTILGNFR